MGRNKQTGLSYFPLDIDTFQDIKIRKLIKRQKGRAFTVYALLLCFIYKSGYYMLWDEELPFIVSEQTGFEEAYIQEVINCCLSIGLFDKDMFKEHQVLTSKGIQKRYQDICKQCRRTSEITDYNLISSEETNISSEEKPISSEEKPISSEEKPINSAESAQIKEKKSKKKETKVSSPQSPPGGGGGDYLSSSLSQKDGKPRNFEGLCQSMNRLQIPQKQQDEIMRISEFGVIGHPVWPLLRQCEDSLTKSKFDRDRIRLPGHYILSKLKEGG